MKFFKKLFPTVLIALAVIIKGNILGFWGGEEAGEYTIKAILNE